MRRIGFLIGGGPQVCREIAFTVRPGKTMTNGEKFDNDKANLLGQPIIETEGGLELTQMQADAWFSVVNTGSAVNAYVGTLGDGNEDIAVPMNGLVIAFKVSTTNTGPSTFALKQSDATAIATKNIFKRGRALVAGDLIAGEWVEVRYESSGDTGAGVWQLQTPGLAESGDVAPGPYFVGTNNASTADALVMEFTPAPSALAAGLKVRFAMPVTNNAGVTLKLQTAAAVDIGLAKAIRRLGVAVKKGDLVNGIMVELLYNGTAWELQGGISAVVGISSGLVIKNNGVSPNSKVDITVDEVMVTAGSGGTGKLLSAVNVTVDIAAAVGANALDTGVEVADAWYYIWVIHNAETGTTAGLFSAANPVGTGLPAVPTLPAGYNHSALVGCIRNTTSNFVNTYIAGRKAWQNKADVFAAKAAANANTYEALAGADLTAFQALIPPFARVASGYLGSPAGQNTSMAVAADANGLGEVMGHQPSSSGNAFDSVDGASSYSVPLKSQQLIYWKSVDTAARNTLRVNGWEF